MSERIATKLQAVGEVNRSGAGWTFTAIAQFYEVVNDRLMYFKYGSGLKTIREAVPAGRVKIHSGHPWDPNASTILGKVIEARETRNDGGVWYKGYLSSVEGDTAQKLIEGVIDENSMELYVLREDDFEVSIDDVPEHRRRWILVEPNGKTKVREIREWKWDAIGLVSSSSQGRAAVLEPPTLVPLEDGVPLAAAGTAWEPLAAAERVREWASRGSKSDAPRAADVARARLATAHLARRIGHPGEFLAQVADVVDGELRYIPAAIKAVGAQLDQLSQEDPATALAVAHQLGRLEQRLTDSASAVYPAEAAAAETITADASSGTESNSSAAPTSPHQPTAGPGSNPPTETAGRNGDPATQQSREDKLREIRAAAVTLGLHDLPDQEVGPHARRRPEADPA